MKLDKSRKLGIKVANGESIKVVERKERCRGGLRTSNEYDLRRLVEKLKAIETDIAKAKKLADAAKKAGGLTAALAEFE